ncbi:uncharacterized protein J5F26_010042 [Ciconia maguari]
MGAALLLPALLRLWRERGHHHLPRDGLRPQLPSALCRGRWMRHPVPSSVQVPPLPSWLPPAKDPALLTSPIPFLFPPGPSAGSTAQSRQWRRLRRRTPPASSAWNLWGTESPTAPWCAQRASTPGSTGAASRDRRCALAFLASSAPSVEIRISFSRTCSSWGSESPSGWCPSARLTRQESASAVPCQGLPQQSWPSAVPCLWASASRRSWKQGRGGRARTPCVRLMPGQQGLIKFPSSFRRPSWENGHAYAGLSERHSRCDASECLCPGGREHAEEEGPWQLLLCCSCAAEGTHRRCSYSRNSTARWECDGCAGLGTGKRQSIRVPLGSGCPGWAWQSLSAPGGPGPPLWPILPRGLGSRALDLPASVTASSASSELAGPSTASQSGLGPSHGSPAPETRSPSTSSQAASGQSVVPPAPETSSPSTGSQAASGQSVISPAPETSSPSTSSQAASGQSVVSPAPETSSPSTGSQAASVPSHGSLALETSSPSTASQAALGPSRGSPALEGTSCSSPPGPDRMRNRSRLNRRAQTPYSRPSRRRDSSRTPAPSAESSTPGQAELGLSHGCPVPETSSPSTASQLPSGSSYGSPALQGSLRASPPGPERVRDRSRLQRRAQTPYIRPSRRRESSRVPAPSAESSTPSQAALGPSHASPAPETSSLSTASQLPSGSSCGSPALESGRRSSSPGPVRMRDRSRLQRRAQTPYSQPGRRRGTSRAPSPSAGPDPPSPAQ